jgi:hypothetical protein
MTARLVTATLAAALLACGSSHAQVGVSAVGTTSPLGMASPLGMGSGSAVAPTGIPMGSTELASPGLSPPLASVTPSGTMPCATATTGATSGAVFDGGGMSGTAGCAFNGSTSTGSAAASGSSPTAMGGVLSTGRAGIPLGSTELAPGGLSPPPLVPLATPAPLVTLAPSTMTSPSAPLATSGTTTTTAPCPSNGVFTPNGIITTPGTAVTSTGSTGSC